MHRLKIFLKRSHSSKDSRTNVTVSHFPFCMMRAWLTVIIPVALAQVKPAIDLQDALQTLGLNKFLQNLREVGLSHILYNSDKCTLFAPTNEAFARLEVRATHSNVSVLNKDELKRILLYHAAYSDWRADDWANDQLIPTAFTGINMRVNIYAQPNSRKNDEKIITVSGVQVLSSNNRAQNGIVHILNDVVYPIGSASAYDTMATLPALSHFKSLIDQYNMIKVLKYKEPLTIFAPINDAFKKLPPQFMDNISLQPAAVAAVMNYHLINGTYHSIGLFRNTRLHSYESSEIVVTDHKTSSSCPVKLNGDACIIHSYPVSNGVLHVIDALLLPAANPKHMLYGAKNDQAYDTQKGLKRK